MTNHAASDRPPVRIGCAGWSIGRQFASQFAGDGSHLQRYSRVLNAVEINSSFYRPHSQTTYARWCESVPESFRFSVKIPKTITHTKRLIDVDSELQSFLEQCDPIKPKLEWLLIQLPPSLNFDAETADLFFALLRKVHDGRVACEARHPSWWSADAKTCLRSWHANRVIADPPPARLEEADFSDVTYVRLHGSPVMYRSTYPSSFLEGVAERLVENRANAPWCVFDNTTLNGAVPNALELTALVNGNRPGG